MSLEQHLAKAMFDSAGCSEGRCAWGERPCCCQERYVKSSNDVVRALRHLGPDEVSEEVEQLRAEVSEQARLNGAGAERELALRAENERLRAAIRRAGVSLDQGVSRKAVSDQLRVTLSIEESR